MLKIPCTTEFYLFINSGLRRVYVSVDFSIMISHGLPLKEVSTVTVSAIWAIVKIILPEGT